MDGAQGRDDRIYCFGRYRFIPGRQSLLYGSTPLRVGTRALDLLHALVRRPGEVIGKYELIRSAWPNQIVQDDNLKVNIAALRRALASADAELHCIATVPGRGYRFVAPLQVYNGAEDTSVSDAIRAGSGELPKPAPVIGRDPVIAELAAALGETRLLTIIGPAGVGKTTVAVEAARQVAPAFAGGVVFIDLAGVENPRLVASAIAFALGVDANLANMVPRLVEALRDRPVLLLLDNCEHLLTAVASVTDNLQMALPALHVLATSREPLHCRAETLYRLAPLTVPPESHGIDTVTALDFPAIQLLVTRAEAQGYRLDAADMPLLVAISRRLDGIALALELAAPQLASGGARALLDLLDHSFTQLAVEGDAVPHRHRTLAQTLDWSYRLLKEDEARLLRHLSVFGGTFTLDDVMGTTTGDLAKPAETVAAWLDALVGKSLLSVAYSAGGLHYRLLDSTRSFAADLLRAAGEEDAALARYARHLLAVFEQAEAEWHWRPREEWTGRYSPRTHDLRRAIEWAFNQENDLELGVRLTSAAIPFWSELSSFAESRARVKTAFQILETLPGGDVSIKMKLAGALAFNSMHSTTRGVEALRAWTNVLAWSIELGNLEYHMRALWGISAVQFFSGRHRKSLQTIAQLIELIERKSDRSALPDAERMRLMEIFYCGEIVAARAGLEAMAQQHVTVANRARSSRFSLDRLVGIRGCVAFVSWVAGHHQRAWAMTQQALDAAATLAYPASHAYAMAYVAIPLAIWSGKIDEAQRYVTTLDGEVTLHEISVWASFVAFYQGAIDAARGDHRGVDQMRRAIVHLIRAHNLIRLPIHLAMLAEAALRHGRPEIARKSIRAAFRRVDRYEENWCRAELLRVRGLIEWADGDHSAGEQTLLHAVRVAEEAGAYMFQQRAAASLAKLGRDPADLTSICDRFDTRSEPPDIAADPHIRP